MSRIESHSNYIFRVGLDLAERFFEKLPDLHWDGSVTFSYGRLNRLNPAQFISEAMGKVFLGGKGKIKEHSYFRDSSKVSIVSDGEEFVKQEIFVNPDSYFILMGGKIEQAIYLLRNFPGQRRELDLLKEELPLLRGQEYYLMEAQLSTEDGSHKIKLLPTDLNSHCPTELELKVKRNGTIPDFDSWYNGLERYAMEKPVSRS